MEYSLNPSAKRVEGFLSVPTGEESNYERKSCEFVDKSDRFRLKDRNFMRQYAHLYSERLMTQRPVLEATARKKWGFYFVTYFRLNRCEAFL